MFLGLCVPGQVAPLVLGEPDGLGLLELLRQCTKMQGFRLLLDLTGDVHGHRDSQRHGNLALVLGAEEDQTCVEGVEIESIFVTEAEFAKS